MPRSAQHTTTGAARQARQQPPPTPRTVANSTDTSSDEHITDAEQLIADSAVSGQVADLTRLPRRNRTVRGEFLRRLAALGESTASLDPRGIQVKGATVATTLDLRECTVSRPIRFYESTFEESALFDSGSLCEIEFKDCALASISAAWAEFARGLRLVDSTVDGDLAFVGTTMAGDLDLSGSTLSSVDGLSAELLHVGGNLRCGNGLISKGPINLRHAKVDGDLDAAGAHLEGPRGWSLFADYATIGGKVGLTDGFSGFGISLVGASIGSDLDCRGATFNPQLRECLVASGAKIQGIVGLGGASSGPVFLNGATLGQLDCSGARLVARAGDVLTADNAEVRGSVELSDAVVTGTLRMAGAKIHGDLVARGTRIDGQLQQPPDATSLTPPARDALVAGRLSVDGSVALNRLHAFGQVRLVRAQIGGDLDLCDARLDNDYGVALMAAECAAARLLLWNTGLGSGINLGAAKIKTIDDDVGSWGTAKRVVLSGLSYTGFSHTAVEESSIEDLGAAPRLSRRIQRRWLKSSLSDPWDPEFRFPWLERSDHFDAADWQQLIGTYRSNGLDAFAVRAEIERQNDRLRRAHLSRLRTAGRWVLRVTIGHGHRSWLALVWALPVVAAFALAVAADPGAFTALSSAPSPKPQPFIYALDTFLPVIDFGLAGKWAVIGWVEWAQVVVIVLGWVLSTLFVAGFTKIVRS